VAIKLEDKKAIVAEVNEAAKGALSAVVADARGRDRCCYDWSPQRCA